MFANFWSSHDSFDCIVKTFLTVRIYSYPKTDRITDSYVSLNSVVLEIGALHINKKKGQGTLEFGSIILHNWIEISTG